MYVQIGSDDLNECRLVKQEAKVLTVTTQQDTRFRVDCEEKHTRRMSKQLRNRSRRIIVAVEQKGPVSSCSFMEEGAVCIPACQHSQPHSLVIEQCSLIVGVL